MFTDTMVHPAIIDDIHPGDALAIMMEANADDPSGWEPEDYVKQHLEGSIFTVGMAEYDKLPNDEWEYITPVDATVIKETKDGWIRLRIEAEFFTVSKKVEVWWWVDCSDNEEFKDSVIIEEGEIIFSQWSSVKELLQKIRNELTVFNTIDSLFI